MVRFSSYDGEGSDNAPRQTAASDDIRRMADGVDFVGWRGPDRISHGGFAAEYADMSLLLKNICDVLHSTVQTAEMITLNNQL